MTLKTQHLVSWLQRFPIAAQPSGLHYASVFGALQDGLVDTDNRLMPHLICSSFGQKVTVAVRGGLE